MHLFMTKLFVYQVHVYRSITIFKKDYQNEFPLSFNTCLVCPNSVLPCCKHLCSALTEENYAVVAVGPLEGQPAIIWLLMVNQPK